jgi:UDP-glucose 4-epimerase
MSILITGVAGLVGSSVAKSLYNENVIGVDNLSGGYIDNIPNNIKFIKKDCIDITADDIFGIDTVFHAACTPYEGLSVFSPHTITQNTYGISTKVLIASVNAGVKKFIFTSSMARYGFQEKVPFDESMIPNPQDPYGIAKYSFEQTLANLADVYGFEYTILVPHNIVGPGQVYSDPYRNVVGIMVNRILQGKQPIIYGDGSQMRSFSDIRDILDPIKKIIYGNFNGEVINIGPDSNYISILNLAEMIAQELNFKLDPIFLDGRPKEVKFANCSADKSKSLLGYEQKISLYETIKDMIDWVSTRGTQPFNFNLPIEVVKKSTPKTWLDYSIFNN